eukprot:4146350-Pleurochrysis_carterae.AAC.1
MPASSAMPADSRSPRSASGASSGVVRLLVDTAMRLRASWLTAGSRRMSLRRGAHGADADGEAAAAQR